MYFSIPDGIIDTSVVRRAIDTNRSTLCAPDTICGRGLTLGGLGTRLLRALVSFRRPFWVWVRDHKRKMATDLEEVILEFLSNHESLNSYKYAKDVEKDHQTVFGTLKSLEALGNVSLCIIIYVIIILSALFMCTHDIVYMIHSQFAQIESDM